MVLAVVLAVVRGVAVRPVHAVGIGPVLRRNKPVFRFLHACPEPVLANDRFPLLQKLAQKRGVV